MSTRSNIAILNNDGTVTTIYCHWDGYPSYNGKILAEYYNTTDKVTELIKYGDLSVLKPNIYPTAPHSFEEPQQDVCIYYHRDRGDDWEEVKPKTYNSLIDLCNSLNGSWIEYLYVYIGGDWWYWDIYHHKSIAIDHLQTELDHIDQQ